MENMPEAIRFAAEAAMDAGLPLCEQCDGDGCRTCAASGHQPGNVLHDCSCLGTGLDVVALSHNLLGVHEDWAAEALEIIAEAHKADEFGECAECSEPWPCIPADVYLGTAGDVYSQKGGQHVPYNDGDCNTCEESGRG
jgi:hypothetical protein